MLHYFNCHGAATRSLYVYVEHKKQHSDLAKIIIRAAKASPSTLGIP